jgi:hypothetical protein
MAELEVRYKDILCSTCLVKTIPGGRKLIAFQYHRPHAWRTLYLRSNSLTIFSESSPPLLISIAGIFGKVARLVISGWGDLDCCLVRPS